MHSLLSSTILVCFTTVSLLNGFASGVMTRIASSPSMPNTAAIEAMRIVDEPDMIQYVRHATQKDHATETIALAVAEPEPVLTFLGSGYAAHYGETVMAKVARNRGMAPSACMLSYTEATDHDLGSYVLVESLIDGDSLWCQIMDMPQPYDYASIKRRKIIVELDFSSAKILCNIIVVAQEPPRACPVKVYR